MKATNPQQTREESLHVKTQPSEDAHLITTSKRYVTGSSSSSEVTIDAHHDVLKEADGGDQVQVRAEDLPSATRTQSD